MISAERLAEIRELRDRHKLSPPALELLAEYERSRKGLRPIPMPQDVLVAVLRNMAELVEAGDSFEGSVEYAMPIPEREGESFPEGTYALVRASYRIGNSMGQGGLRTIGTL